MKELNIKKIIIEIAIFSGFIYFSIFVGFYALLLSIDLWLGIIYFFLNLFLMFGVYFSIRKRLKK